MEVSKERMIELVKNAPDGAVYWGSNTSTHNDHYYDKNKQCYFDDIGYKYWKTCRDDLIELDYSVLEDKPKVKDLGDEFERLFWEYDSELSNASSKRMLFKKYLSKANLIKAEGEDKPVYTQEMHEAGELPPVGCELMAYRDKEWPECQLLKSRLNNAGITVHAVMDKFFVLWWTADIKPIDTRTDQEKLIDELTERLVLIKKSGKVERLYAIDLINDFNITRKGESNES